MASLKKNPIFELKNHAETARILGLIPGSVPLPWYDAAVRDVTKRWFLLGEEHLRAAKLASLTSRRWRATVSRCYYACYNFSRSVRYSVVGQVKTDVDDHKCVGDLPDDFPNRAFWSTFLDELRKDRNVADYEPWQGARKALAYEPGKTFGFARQLRRLTRTYLGGRGIVL